MKISRSERDAAAACGARIDEMIDRTTGSVADFARRLGYSESAVRKWIRNESEPGATALRRMCYEFGINPEYILGIAIEPYAVTWDGFGFDPSKAKQEELQ